MFILLVFQFNLVVFCVIDIALVTDYSVSCGGRYVWYDFTVV